MKKKIDKEIDKDLEISPHKKFWFRSLIEKIIEDKVAISIIALLSWIVPNIWSTYSYIDSERQKLQHSQYVEAVRQQEVKNQTIRSELENQQKAFHIIWNSITNVRNIREITISDCRSTPDLISNVDYIKQREHERIKATYNLVDAVEYAYANFSKEINEIISEFILWQWPYTTKDICAGKAPTDDEYKNRVIPIDKLMKLEILQNTKRLK